MIKLGAGDGAPIGSLPGKQVKSSGLMKPESGGGSGAERSFQKLNNEADSTGFLVTNTAQVGEALSRVIEFARWATRGTELDPEMRAEEGIPCFVEELCAVLHNEIANAIQVTTKRHSCRRQRVW